MPFQTEAVQALREAGFFQLAAALDVRALALDAALADCDVVQAAGTLCDMHERANAMANVLQGPAGKEIEGAQQLSGVLVRLRDQAFRAFSDGLANSCLVVPVSRNGHAGGAGG